MIERGHLIEILEVFRCSEYTLLSYRTTGPDAAHEAEWAGCRSWMIEKPVGQAGWTTWTVTIEKLPRFWSQLVDLLGVETEGMV
jgi:hypothetical protein